MISKKKKSVENTNSRDAILDATEEIMITEGYAGVTSRRVATKAGLKSKLLHYYFRSMDDLFIATYQRLEDRFHERFVHAVAADQPVRAMWRLNLDGISTGLVLEFIALAAHRRAIRVLIARSANRDRDMHVSALTGILEAGGLHTGDPSPAVLALLMASVARTLVTEKALGVTNTHAEMVAYVERHLARIDSYRPRAASPRQLKQRTPPDRAARRPLKSAARQRAR